MPVKLRLSRKGRKRAPFYHIIVADSRSPRDGKFIEKIGTYNPMTKPATIEIDRNAAYDWLLKGAQPTDTVKAILRFKGVYYKKHLMRGVKKGAMTVEQADVMWQQWIDEKESRITARRADTIAEMEAFRKMVSGEAKAKVVVADQATKEAAHAFMETSDEAEVTPEPATTAPEVQDTVEVAVQESVEVVADEAAVVEEVAEVAPEVVEEPIEIPAEAEVVETTPEVVTETSEEAEEAPTEVEGDETAPEVTEE
jgi:small subunit ribosomal protein S16